MPNNNRLNVFDLDGTLIKVNSFREISKKLVGNLLAKRKLGFFLNLAAWYVLRKAGIVNHINFKRRVVKIFEKSLMEEEKQRIVQGVFCDNINKVVFQRMLEAENCIVSTSAPFSFVSRMPFKEDDIVISSLDRTTAFPDPSNFGPGKVENLKFYFGDQDFSVLNFYTDSSDDQELVKLSQNAFLVLNGVLTKIK